MLRRFYRLYQEAHVPFFAAALAYYALLSLMPLLFLLVGLFGFLLSGNPALRTEVFQALTELTLALFPARPEMAQSLLDFLTRGAFPLTLGSGLLLLWSGSNFFAALSYALGLIFGRPPGVRSRLLALVTPFLLGLGLILLALLGLALGFLARFLPQGLQGLLGPLEELVPLSTAFLLFLLTYALLRGSGGLRTLPPSPPGRGGDPPL